MAVLARDAAILPGAVPMNVDQYIGIPFAEANCWELIRRIYSRELGIVLPLHDTIDTDDGEALRKAIEGDTAGPLWWRVDRGQERPFDVLIMRGFYKSGGRLHSADIHCGMVIGPQSLIHVEDGRESVALSYSHPTIGLGRIKKIWRHRSQT